MSGRLGLAFCHALAHRYRIVTVHHDRPTLFPSQHPSYTNSLKLGARLPANEHRIWSVDAQAVEHVVEVTLARPGTVDLLVNAAGTSYRGSFLDERRLIDSWLLNPESSTCPVRVPGAGTERVRHQQGRAEHLCRAPF
ncbi:hypothetical protein [Streptomyces sp. NPDC006739]|uniref:hypothetical protein n=1 Tax=Streptomyces sp. NPDC006739 TaxID=3364763 RepID=UPI0036BF9EA7